MLAELLQVCSPDAQIFIRSNNTFHFLRLVLLPPPSPPPVSHEVLWTTKKVLLGGARHGCPSTAWPAKEANQLMSCKPNHKMVSGARRTQHPPTLPGLTGSLNNVLGTLQKMLFNFCPFYFPLTTSAGVFSASPPRFKPALLSGDGASWACYPNPTVVVDFVSLTRGTALYTCQGANESNKQGPGKRRGQASAVELHWVFGHGASLETREPTICLFDVWWCSGFDENFGEKKQQQKKKQYSSKKE